MFFIMSPCHLAMMAHVSLVTSTMRVAPLKRLTILCLELCSSPTSWPWFSLMLRIDTWWLRCLSTIVMQLCSDNLVPSSGPALVNKLTAADYLWLSVTQSHCFQIEIKALRKNQDVSYANSWIFLDLSELAVTEKLYVCIHSMTSSHIPWQRWPDEIDHSFGANSCKG